MQVKSKTQNVRKIRKVSDTRYASLSCYLLGVGSVLLSLWKGRRDFLIFADCDFLLFIVGKMCNIINLAWIAVRAYPKQRSHISAV